MNGLFNNTPPPASIYVSKLNNKPEMTLCHFCIIVIGTRSLSMSDYLFGLESSGWLRHIKSVLDAAVFLTKVDFSFLFSFLHASEEHYTHRSGCNRFPLNSCVLVSVAASGCDWGRRQRLGSLFRRLGQNCSGLLSGCAAHGPLLPHHQGLHGNYAYHHSHLH